MVNRILSYFPPRHQEAIRMMAAKNAAGSLKQCGIRRTSAGLILPCQRAYTPIAYTAWRCPYDRGLTHQSQGAGCVHHRDPHHHPAGGKALRTFQIDRAYGSDKTERLIWAIE